MARIQRRRVLRGMLGGGVVTVGLPLLDCFLNGNGTALASGETIPLRLGTWHWSLGMAAKVFVPNKKGASYDLPEEIACFAPIRQHMNLLTNFAAFRDGYQNFCHLTGWVVTRSGSAPKTKDSHPDETFDVTIANQIGKTTRYKTLTATADGGARTTYSYENANTPNSSEFSPIQLYQRLFGPDFQDPNAAAFRPDPNIMTRKSVLSVVMDDTRSLNTQIGADDRARLDQYFTGLRELEQRFNQRLTKPAPIAACKPGEKITKEPPVSTEVKVIADRHKTMSELLAMAVACDQTRVFNMAHGNIGTTREGYDKTHHSSTHEEPVDETLGYQPNVSWFTRRQMEAWVQLVTTFASIKEGDGTLLDHCFIAANTDHSLARIHQLDNLPMFTAGKLGGKVKTGLHIDGGGTTTARLGYTAMKVMGLEMKSWGTKSNETSKEIGEILV